MKETIDQTVSGELSWIVNEILANPYSTVMLSFVIHDGKIARMKRGIEVQEKLHNGEQEERRGA